jgi:hypothetical protein
VSSNSARSLAFASVAVILLAIWSSYRSYDLMLA